MEGMHRYLIVFTMCFLCTLASAQVSIPADLDRAEQRYKEYINENATTTLYRITIFLTRDRREMESERKNIEDLFPDLETEWEYEQPYYYIRTGRFLTKKHSWPTMSRIQTEYPNAILSNERIIPSDFFPE